MFNPVIMLLILASYAFLAYANVTSDGGFLLFSVSETCWGESGMPHECKATGISLTQGSACKMSSFLAILRINPEHCDKMTLAKIFTVVRVFSNCHYMP